MKHQRKLSFLLAATLAIPGAAGAATVASAATVAAEDETVIQLSDSSVTVDGVLASTSSSSAVYTSDDIVYYEEGTDDTYGEGAAGDAHSAEEADAHTVVTITEPGTYRVSGELSAGQLAVDLGEDAESDPSARVTLILDGVDITNTVAPAVIFYSVYEPYSASEDTQGTVDLTDAGAQVILADGSINEVSGSYVAKIYKEGTTKKLHKYDGAFYSKMSMRIDGEAEGDGELYIEGENEGLDSELHLSIDGGHVYIESQDDGINTNEDGISVTTINGGYLHVNAGLGAEGDAIDSNGYLTINGGTIVTMASDHSPDGGVDADKGIVINGGTVIAFGTRNDATEADSLQPFIELSFATTQAIGTEVVLKDADGNVLLDHTAEKAFQSLTFSSDELELEKAYQLYMNGVQQQYTGNSFGMGGGFGGGMPPEGGFPDGEMPEGGFGGGTPPEGFPDGEMPEGGFGGGTPPEGGMGGFTPGMDGEQTDVNAAASSDFIITSTTHSFSGISEATDAVGKTVATFTINDGQGIANVASGETALLEQIKANMDVPASDIQVTITDVPSENFSETGLLSELQDDFSQIMPTEDGIYRLTVAVVSSNETYTGVSQSYFTIGGLPFTDVSPVSELYSAVKKLYESGVMIGTGATTFDPNSAVTRATAITTLGRLLGVEEAADNSFTDVKQGSWYAGYVGWAVLNAIVQGDGAGNFMPDQGITAEQMKLILERYAALSDVTWQSAALEGGNSSRVLTRSDLALILSSMQ
ncbi:carbohydrate-binding domain-containing protein [Paenibacillus sp. HB172176]|uniref:carbohydrate-binding domain-containing protein n=1 Tax=Paenibacillus sp. HB172176 TaxID=2493690 RepID=UPI00143C37B8|nr:carbohydrate-binding domain-containing protein [Paenibacillus sp. HB172176]